MIIETFRDVSLSPDFVWRGLSNIDTEHEYWEPIRFVRKKWVDNSTMEREVRVLNGISFREKIILRPSSIYVQITDGPFTGTKSIDVIPIDRLKTRIRIRWDIQLNRFLRLFSFVTSRYISRQNAKALTKMEARIMEDGITT